MHVGDDDLLDFTTLNPDMLNPVLRYQTGDAGRVRRRALAARDKAMRILGRRDSVVQVRGLGLHVDDIVAQVEQEPGVTRAQVLITEQAGRVSNVDVLLLAQPRPRPDERLRKELHGFDLHAQHGLPARPRLVPGRRSSTR